MVFRPSPWVESFPAGSSCHNCLIVGLKPRFRGSHATVGLLGIVTRQSVVIDPLVELKFYRTTMLKACLNSSITLFTDVVRTSRVKKVAWLRQRSYTLT